VYELADLLGKYIDGQFYGEELTPVIVTKNRTYPILKILRKRIRNGSIEYLVRWPVILRISIRGFPLKL
jgi:hypothetical protein